MTKSTTASTNPKFDSQAERFKDAAREAMCDEDETRWEERLKKVAKQKSVSDGNP